MLVAMIKLITLRTQDVGYLIRDLGNLTRVLGFLIRQIAELLDEESGDVK